MTFNLKNYLSVLTKNIIFIVGNSDDPIDIDEKTKKLESCFSDERNHVWHHPIELIGNDSDFKGVLLEFSENIPKAP